MDMVGHSANSIAFILLFPGNAAQEGLKPFLKIWLD
jgi:hypothetical protein